MPSKDPKQQQLRDKKRAWNAAYKELTMRLKAFKNGLNGKGDVKFSIPAGDIKNPLPEQVGATLQELTTEFQKLVNDAAKIISEQKNYSNTRRKKQEKSKAAPVANQELNLGKQLERLSYFEAKYDNKIVKEASNPLSRSWQYLKSIFYSGNSNKIRSGLLRAASETYYSFLDFENEVLSTEISNIPSVIGKFQIAEYNFENLKQAIYMLKSKDGSDKGKKPSQRQKEVQLLEINDLDTSSMGIDDLKKIIEPFLIIPETKGLAETYLIYHHDFMLSDNDKKPIILEEARKKFAKFPAILYNLVKSKSNFKLDTSDPIIALEKILQFLNNSKKEVKEVTEINAPDKNDLEKNNENIKKSFYNEEMVKISHNMLTRWLRKQLLKTLPFNKTSAHRLQISDIIGIIKKNLKLMMDSLEKELNLDELKKTSDLISKNLNEIENPLHILTTLSKAEYVKNIMNPDNAGKKRPLYHDQLLDPVMRRKLRSEFSRDF